eukprot:Tamp_11182.p1 GENE.Tamp_11182~~Tamp_11182.p1  ORF type:complete len:255 (-),score=46.47 Tamp_11182:996-1760(-)
MMQVGYLNDVGCSCRCSARLRDQLTQNFVSNFPEAGEKMLGALQMELDDIKSSLDKLSKSATEAVVLLVSPDVVGQVDRMLSRANFAASSPELVFSTDQPKRGLLSKLTGAKQEEEKPAPGGNKAGGGDTQLLATRLERAVKEVVLPLQSACDRTVIENIAISLLEKLALRLEGIALGGGDFSEAGGICLQAQIRGIIDIFTRGELAQDSEDGALVPDKACRSIMRRARAISLLVSVERVSAFQHVAQCTLLGQ